MIMQKKVSFFCIKAAESVSFDYDIEKAKEVTQKDIKVVEESRRSGDPAVLIASSDKAKTVLGWKPEYDDLGTIIKTAWKWHSTHPNGYNK